MSNIDYLAKMLGYHTKGREAVLREGTDLKNDKNHNGVDDKQENEPKDNTVKKTVKMAKEDCCEYCGTDKCKCDMKEEAELEEKRGLWDNIHAKRKRIKNGSGERMRKPGEKGAPSAQDLKNSQKEEYEDALADDLLNVYEAILELDAEFKELGMSVTEAFQVCTMSDEELEEGFGQMSKIKRLIAQKKAGRRKKMTPGYTIDKSKK